MLDDSLKRAKVTSRSLVIEITERSTAEGEVAMEAIRSLRRAGHSIHIDDFGTGHSNLDKLLYLFADTIKIDMAFTRVIGTDSVTVAILPQILAMAKSLGLDVVVEGVETEYQADYFTPATEKMYGQGWLYGHPVPVEEFLGVLAKSLHRGLAPSDLPATRTANAGGLHIVGA
jgi:sensor c-di-GMP phosphodiesterase-like protein